MNLIVVDASQAATACYRPPITRLPLPPTLSVFPSHLSLGLLRRNAQPIVRFFGVHGRFFELP